MAYDGIALAALAGELNTKFKDAGISKVAQPGKDELLLTLKAKGVLTRLLISANPSNPCVFEAEENVPSPASAPSFCMLLRKNIGGGRIRRVYQPSSAFLTEGLERILVFEIDHSDEMGDRCIRYLVCELMGKYSNILLVSKDLTVMDSIRHISAAMSSVREVYPGCRYFIPETIRKTDPVADPPCLSSFADTVRARKGSVYEAIFNSYTGISPSAACELCHRADCPGDLETGQLTDEQLSRLFSAFDSLLSQIRSRQFEPNILYEGGEPSELSAISLDYLNQSAFSIRKMGSMEETIRLFYAERAKSSRIRVRSENLRHLVKTLTERTARKLSAQEKQYRDTDKMDQYRLYGELINTFGYSLAGGEKKLECQNYYDNDALTVVPLDPLLSARENAKRYFERYGKLKRTRAALKPQIEASRNALYLLDSVSNSLRLAETEADLRDLKNELTEYGFVHSKETGKSDRRPEARSKPLHFVSSDGFDIFVGRSSLQNEELTFKTASPEDYWFHAKNIPGSHVIVRTNGAELPEKTCLEAAALAAYYSKATAPDAVSAAGKVEVDYVRRKELKKVPQAPRGFVVYHTNRTVRIEPRSST